LPSNIDLKELARASAPDRAFLSLYLSSPKALGSLEKRIKNAASMLKDQPDEAEYLKENTRLVREYLEKKPWFEGGMVFFVCWAVDFFRALPLTAPIKDLLWVDSSPYIRPLAQLQDEYEDFAVVVADNKAARIFLVTLGKADSPERLRGDIKNHVKKGGWSQQRYERRRDKQLFQYSKEIVGKLTELEKEGDFRRVLLVGSKEILIHIRKAMPARLAAKLAGEKALDLGKGAEWVEKELFDLFFIEERRSEQELWDRIKGEYLRKGLAAVGVKDVMDAARAGRVEKMIVTRNFKVDGVRCRDCEHLSREASDSCPECSSKSVFEVDVINEIVEMLASTGADADFVDPLPGLSEVGDIAALLRY